MQLSMEILGVVVLSIFGFYAVRLLSSFKRGMLEKGWKNVTQGAIILVLAQIPFLLAGITPSTLSSILIGAGDLLRLIGIIFLIVGFRAQYQIWRVDNKDLSPMIET